MLRVSLATGVAMVVIVSVAVVVLGYVALGHGPAPWWLRGRRATGPGRFGPDGPAVAVPGDGVWSDRTPPGRDVGGREVR